MRVGDRLLAVTDDAEGIVMGQEVGQNLVDREWSCRVWVTRVDHVVAWCGCNGALATAPLAPATPANYVVTRDRN